MRDKPFRVVHQPLKETLSVVELDRLVVHDCPLVKHAMELPAMSPPLHIVSEQRELPRRVSGPTERRLIKRFGPFQAIGGLTVQP